MAVAARLAAFAIAVATLAMISGGTANAGGPVGIDIGDAYFCNASFEGGVCETVINVGDTVEWTHVGQIPHTTTECGASCDSPSGSPLWNSGILTGIDTFQYTFNTAGTYLYFCEVHPALQRGRIVVQGATGPTNTPVATTATGPGTTAPAGPTATTSASGLPSAGAASGGDSSSGLWVLVIGLAGAALAAAGLGVMAYRRNGNG
ncbi:MAG: plastocyanin/azurin family copper-binding protein [Dehalococcoidia bacterium]